MTRVRLRGCLLAALSVMVLSASGDEPWRFTLPDAVLNDGNSAKARAGIAVVEMLPARGREFAEVSGRPH